jgi:transcription elongation factor Elf1
MMSDYPFRLLCKQCNSYLSTVLMPISSKAMRLYCRNCGNGQTLELDKENQAMKPCSCGSGKPRREAVDARGIFLTFVCDACEKRRLASFRPEVLTDPNYTVLEPIDPE